MDSSARLINCGHFKFKEREGRRERWGYAGVLCVDIGDIPASSPENGGGGT